MECIIIMRLFSWNHSRGSETSIYNIMKDAPVLLVEGFLLYDLCHLLLTEKSANMTTGIRVIK
jgi:hypothetical protein